MGLLRNGSLIPVPGVFVLCISLPSLLLLFCFLSLSCIVKIQRGCPFSVGSESAGKTQLPKTGVCLVRGPTYDLPCGDQGIEDGGSRTFCNDRATPTRTSRTPSAPSFFSCALPERSRSLGSWHGAVPEGCLAPSPTPAAQVCLTHLMVSLSSLLSFHAVPRKPCCPQHLLPLSPSGTSRDVESCHLGKSDFFSFFFK